MKIKLLPLSLVVGISMCAATIVKKTEVKEAKVWLGVGYVAAKKGASAENCLAMGLVGVYQAGLWGSVGGPVGAAMGIGFSL